MSRTVVNASALGQKASDTSAAGRHDAVVPQPMAASSFGKFLLMVICCLNLDRCSLQLRFSRKPGVMPCPDWFSVVVTAGQVVAEALLVRRDSGIQVVGYSKRLHRPVRRLTLVST